MPWLSEGGRGRRTADRSIDQTKGLSLQDLDMTNYPKSTMLTLFYMFLRTCGAWPAKGRRFLRPRYKVIGKGKRKGKQLR